MTNKERELKDAIVDFLDEGFVNGKMEDMINIRVAKRLARAIIAKYPQIFSKKVWEGNATNLIAETVDDIEEINFGHPKTIQVFIREVK